MRFLPDDIVPSMRRDGKDNCRLMLSQIKFYIDILQTSGLEIGDLEKMFAQHSKWYRSKSLKMHERSMMCALATVICGGRTLPRY